MTPSIRLTLTAEKICFFTTLCNTLVPSKCVNQHFDFAQSSKVRCCGTKRSPCTCSNVLIRVTMSCSYTVVKLWFDPARASKVRGDGDKEESMYLFQSVDTNNHVSIFNRFQGICHEMHITYASISPSRSSKKSKVTAIQGQRLWSQNSMYRPIVVDKHNHVLILHSFSHKVHSLPCQHWAVVCFFTPSRLGEGLLEMLWVCFVARRDCVDATALQYRQSTEGRKTESRTTRWQTDQARRWRALQRHHHQ